MKRKLQLILLLVLLWLFQAVSMGFLAQKLFAEGSDDLYLDARYLPLEEELTQGDDAILRRR